MGIKDMVISTRNELLKIEKFKSNYSQFRNKPVTYFWSTEDNIQNMQELESVQQLINGLFFEAQSSFAKIRINQITRKILVKGTHISELISQGHFYELNDLREWKREQLTWGGRRIIRTIDICDYSEVENYVLVTRSLAQSKTIISEEARKLIDSKDIHQNCLLVEYGGQKWLFSTLKEFPMNQQNYLFEIECLRQAHKLSKPIIY